MRLEPTMLRGQIVALGANARTSTEIPVSTGDVVIIGVIAASTGAFSMNFTPSDTSKKYASDLVPSTMIAGNAQNPFRLDGGPAGDPIDPLKTGLRIRNASTITLDVQNDTGVANTITVAFFGFRIIA